MSTGRVREWRLGICNPGSYSLQDRTGQEVVLLQLSVSLLPAAFKAKLHIFRAGRCILAHVEAAELEKRVHSNSYADLFELNPLSELPTNIMVKLWEFQDAIAHVNVIPPSLDNPFEQPALTSEGGLLKRFPLVNRGILVRIAFMVFCAGHTQRAGA